MIKIGVVWSLKSVLLKKIMLRKLKISFIKTPSYSTEIQSPTDHLLFQETLRTYRALEVTAITEKKNYEVREFFYFFIFIFIFSLFLPIVPDTFWFVPGSRYHFCSRAPALWAALFVGNFIQCFGEVHVDNVYGPRPLHPKYLSSLLLLWEAVG